MTSSEKMRPIVDSGFCIVLKRLATGAGASASFRGVAEEVRGVSGGMEVLSVWVFEGEDAFLEV